MSELTANSAAGDFCAIYENFGLSHFTVTRRLVTKDNNQVYEVDLRRKNKTMLERYFIFSVLNGADKLTYYGYSADIDAVEMFITLIPNCTSQTLMDVLRDLTPKRSQQ